MYLHDPNLLHNLSFRYAKDQIYTYTANILIAVNPYKQLGIYSKETMAEYHKGTPHSMEPHVFGIAERSYRLMKANKCDQSIIVSGDSGAGKTENCKYVMRYLCTVAGRGVGQLESQILEANPILEAFGNAKTLRNKNSSRFGKFVEIHFDADHFVAGAGISTYLLEKSRLVRQAPGERNYHVFYQLLAGGDDALLSSAALERDASKYKYLSRSGCTTIEGVDDAADFKHLVAAMGLVGIGDAKRRALFGVLAGLLHLGNVKFEPKDEDDDDCEESIVASSTEVSLAWACAALGCTVEALTKCLLSRTMQSGSKRGSVYTIPLRPSDAKSARDSLAKHIYGHLFDWIVARINAGIPMAGEAAHHIGILDISGFEYFERNGFEQFLINTCNEKIQQYFIRQIMKQEQEIYIQEGLRWKKVNFRDNFGTIQLLEKKRTGIMALLEESCMMPRATDRSFTRKVHQVQGDHPSLMRPTACPKTIAGQPRLFRDEEAYIVRHFAADVCYSTDGYLLKNNDTLHADLRELVQVHSNDFVRELFDEAAGGGGAASSSSAAASSPSSLRGQGRFATVSTTFLRGLDALMERLEQTNSNFIRCINPNLEQRPGLIVADGVLTQLRCSGMLEALRILQAGFPTRCLFTDLYNKYRGFMPEEIQRLKPSLFCEALLVAHDLEGGADFQMGLSRVFFRAGKLAFMDDLLSSSPAKVDEIVRKVRRWLARKRWRQFIMAVVSCNLLGRIIEDIRAAARAADEQRRMQDEAYQAELRRREEELRRKREEEERAREEAERLEREAKEARRREKMEERRREQDEMKRLRAEAAAKLDLEQQLVAERDTYAELEQSLNDDIGTLEEALCQEQAEKIELLKQLADERTRTAVLEETQESLQEELRRLRERIAELEHALSLAKGRMKALENALDAERSAKEKAIAELEQDLVDLADQKDREIAKAYKERDEAIALMRAEMEATIAKIQSAADARVQEAMTEKAEEVQRIKGEKDHQIEVLEKTATKPLKTGWLMKRGGRNPDGRWQKRWFVLKSNFVAYYRDPKDRKPSGLVDIEQARVYRSAAKPKKKSSKKEQFCFELDVPLRTYYIRADSEESLVEWMRAINLAKARHLGTVTIDLNETSVQNARNIQVSKLQKSPRSPRS
jgi:myosin VI